MYNSVVLLNFNKTVFLKELQKKTSVSVNGTQKVKILALFRLWNNQYTLCDRFNCTIRQSWHVGYMRNTGSPKETAVGTSIWVGACPFRPLSCSKQPNCVSVLLLKHPVCTLRPSKFLCAPALTCEMDEKHTQTQRNGCEYLHMGQRVPILTVVLL